MSDKHSGERRARTSIDRIKLNKSATQLSVNTQRVYQVQKRYPRSLYKNNRLTDFVKLKRFDVGGVFYAQNNESSYIYPTETLFRSATAGLDAGRRKDSLDGGHSSNTPDAVRPFTYLHRLPTALYRSDDQNVKIKVKRKKTALIYDSNSEIESPPMFLHDESGDSMNINKVQPLKDARQTIMSAESVLDRQDFITDSDSDDEDSEEQTSFILADETTSPSIQMRSQENNHSAERSGRKSDSWVGSRRDAPGSAINVPIVTMEIKNETLVSDPKSLSPTDDPKSKLKKRENDHIMKHDDKNHLKESRQKKLEPNRAAEKNKNECEPTTPFVIDIENIDEDEAGGSELVKNVKIPKKQETDEDRMTKLKSRTTLDSDSSQTLISPTGDQPKKRLKEAFERKLIEKYPFMFAIIYSEILIIFSVVKIALQIVLMLNKAPLNYSGCGLWSGLIGIFIFYWVIHTTIKRGYYSYRISQIAISVGIVAFLSSAIINSISISKHRSCPSPCSFDSSMLYVNIILMVAEVITFAFSFVFLLDNFYEVDMFPPKIQPKQ